MKTLKDFRTYINENFEESGNLSSKLQAFLNGKEKMIKGWFEKGLLNNAALADVQITENTLGLAKDLIFEFNDGQYYYQGILSVSMNNYKDGTFKNAAFKLKKYSMDVDNEMNTLKGLEIDNWDSNNPDNAQNGKITFDEFKPEFILDIISKMEDEPQALGTEEIEQQQSIQQQGVQNQQGTEF